MPKNLLRSLLLTAAIVILASQSGCSGLKFLTYVATPEDKGKDVKGEYENLAGKSVAVIIAAGPEVLLEYPTIQLEIADAVNGEIRKNIHDARPVNPARVIRYQEEHPRWQSLPPEQLAGTFESDYALVIALVDFSTRESGSVHLSRGHLIAQASLYQAPRPDKPGLVNPVWKSRTIESVYPPTSTSEVPAADERGIRLKTAHAFADTLVKNFYTHKESTE